MTSTGTRANSANHKQTLLRGQALLQVWFRLGRHTALQSGGVEQLAATRAAQTPKTILVYEACALPPLQKFNCRGKTPQKSPTLDLSAMSVDKRLW